MESLFESVCGAWEWCFSPDRKKRFPITYWNHIDEKKARRFLAIWCRDAWHSGIKQLAVVANTLALYSTGLLTYFKNCITSGALEGLVNKIKTLKGSFMASGMWSILNSGYTISILRGIH